MKSGRLYLVILILAIGCQQVCFAQNKPSVPANGTPAKVELDPQLNLNRKALLTGDIEAADLMLFHKDPNARKILLDVLRQNENSPARIAVCRALDKARAEKKLVKNVQEFIDPLLVVFSSENGDEARLATEATLIFEYAQINQSFEKLLGDASKPAGAKVNVVRALKLRLRDMSATIKLLTLVDNSDKQVSAEARKALEFLGMEVGEDVGVRKKIIDGIVKRGREAFLDNRLVREVQEKQRAQAELEDLLRSYLVLLGKAYKGSDDAAKATFLVEHLGNSETPVKLWALEEADQWRKGTSDYFPREQLEPILIGLIADSDRDVRLRTADLLAMMKELIFARPLLAQLEVEQDGQVKTKLFEALGWVCSSAIPSSEPAEISPDIKDIRALTLKWAEKFLAEDKDAEKVRNGAEVIEKLLKRDGLEDKEVKKYLDLLLARYDREKGKSGGALTGELLSAMAGLCTPNSTCGTKAGELYWSSFEKALPDETDLIRVAAVEGLANIEKTRALDMLREDRFVNDPNPVVRHKVIALANVVGDKRDLQWLSEKIGVNSESKPAWQAMVNIFKGSDAGIVNGWVEKLTAESNAKLTDQQKIGFLATAVEKAESEDKPQMLKDVRVRLAALYRKAQEYEKAEECLKKLQSMATPEQKTEVVDDLLCLYFAWPKTNLAVTLLAVTLAEKDLDADGVLLKTLDKHLTGPTKGVDPKVVVAQLAKIKTPEDRKKWKTWLDGWQARLKKSEQPVGKPKKPDK